MQKTTKMKTKVARNEEDPLSAAQIDELIGANFVGQDIVVSNRGSDWTTPAMFPYASSFLSGPVSHFIKESAIPPSVHTALTIHREAERLKKQRIRASLISLVPDAKQKSRFLKSLSRTSTTLRNFIVDEIAIFDIALATATEEAKEMLEQLTGSRVENLNTSRVAKAAEYMVELHLMNKLASLLRVSPEVRKQALQHIGNTDGKKDMSSLRALLPLLAARKGTDQPMRGVEETRLQQSSTRDSKRTRAVRASGF